VLEKPEFPAPFAGSRRETVEGRGRQAVVGERGGIGRTVATWTKLSNPSAVESRSMRNSLSLPTRLPGEIDGVELTVVAAGRWARWVASAGVRCLIERASPATSSLERTAPRGGLCRFGFISELGTLV